MLNTSSQEAIVQLLVVALPVATLALLIILLVRRKSGKPATKAHPPMKAFDDGPAHPDDAHVSAAGEASAVLPVVLPVVMDDETAIEHLAQQIASLAALGQKNTLAPLYLQLASAHQLRGNTEGQLSALRAAAGLAAQHGPPSAHAEARVHLAEAAYLAGDLTSACEHWQLARGAFQDDGQKDAHAKIEKRMRDHGCPTDWVLTDF